MNSALLMVFMLGRRSELWHAGYRVLGGFVDQVVLLEPVQKAAGMKLRFPELKTNALCDVLSLTIFSEPGLKDKGIQKNL